MSSPKPELAWLRCGPCLAFLLLVWAGDQSCRAADVIEFLSGARVEGQVKQIDKEKKTVAFETQIAGRVSSRVYQYGQIHAVTYQGKRYVLNEKSESPSTPAPTGSTARKAPAGPRPDVDALIKRAGETPPDWFDSTPLDFPKTLDLTWPEPAPEGWNNQQNMGQYIWDIINPNPNRWRHGVKLMHHLLEVNQDQPTTTRRIMNELGRMYHNLLRDYARAAYWWRRAGIERGDAFPHSAPRLAECYAQLGRRDLALDLLDRLAKGGNSAVLTGCLKAYGDLGELTKAEAVANRLVPAYQQHAFCTGEIYLLLGDAHRMAGNHSQAIRHYERVLAEKGELKGRVQQYQNRAKSNIEAIQLFAQSDVARVPDGVYSDSSPGYEGPIQVEVTVRDRNIVAVRVTRHTEKQFYSALTDTPAKIIQKNGVQGVDTTSSATITSEAIINAAAKALAGAAP